MTGLAEATCTWYLFLYAADGAPVLPAHPPIQIALMTDQMICNEAGQWLVAHRRFQPWFEGGTPTTNPVLGSAGTGAKA